MKRISIKTIVIVLTCSLCIGSSCNVNSGRKSIYMGACKDSKARRVKFSDILGSPEEFDSKFIEIEGYFAGQFEQSAFFENISKQNKAKALWLLFGSPDTLLETESGVNLLGANSEFNRINYNRIVIRGVFDSHFTGHLDQYFGGIKNICYVKIL